MIWGLKDGHLDVLQPGLPRGGSSGRVGQVDAPPCGALLLRGAGRRGCHRYGLGLARHQVSQGNRDATGGGAPRLAVF